MMNQANYYYYISFQKYDKILNCKYNICFLGVNKLDLYSILNNSVENMFSAHDQC